MRVLTECPVCASTQIEESYRDPTGGGAQGWQVFRCEECSHGFLNPQPSWEELTPYYGEDYVAYDPSHGGEGNEEQAASEASRAGTLRHTPIRKGVRLLDVGVGGGYFLRVARRLGAEVQGVDPSEIAASRARQAGLKVFVGTVEEFSSSSDGKRFDVITANHVLEHVPKPVDTLSAMRKLLAPGGLICIAVPNADCWACRSLRGRWHSTDLPRHLMQFNLRSLQQCGARAGLKVSTMYTYSLPSATAASLRTWLRHRMLLPERLTARIPIIEGFVASRISNYLDKSIRGEAIIAHFQCN